MRILCIIGLLINICSIPHIISGQGNADSKRYIIEASEMIMKEDFQGALVSINTGIEKKLELYDSHYLRGLIYHRQGNLKLAIQDYTTAILIEPNNPYPHLQLATIKQSEKDYEGALRNMDQVIEKGLRNEIVYDFRALIRRSMKDTSGVLKEYQAALEHDPMSVISHLNIAIILFQEHSRQPEKGHLDQAIKLLEVFTKNLEEQQLNHTQNKDSELSSKTMGPLSVNSVIDSKSLLDSMIRSNQTRRQSNIDAIYFNLANMYEVKNDLEMSLNTVNRGMQKNFSFALLEKRGNLHLKLNRYSEAIEDYDKLMEKVRNSFLPLLSRGIAYLMLGKTDEAEKDITSVKMMYPQHLETIERRLAEANKQLSEKEVK